MTLTAIICDDLVVGRMTGIDGGPPIGEDVAALPDAALRFNGTNVIDARSVTLWHVDARGTKHLLALADRQALTCAWDAPLVRDGGAWRVMSAGEVLAPRIKAECGRRILAVASANTQMNLTAAQAAGRFSVEDRAAYAAALDWVDAMRARCAELIAAGDAGFAADAKWPPVQAGVVALAARF